MARSLLAIGLLLMAAIGPLGWQRFGGAPSAGLQPYDQSDLSIPSEFFFSRLRYNAGYVAATDIVDSAADGRRTSRAPTTIASSPPPSHPHRFASPLNVVDIDDDHMWDYPWIYAVGVSKWALQT